VQFLTDALGPVSSDWYLVALFHLLVAPIGIGIDLRQRQGIDQGNKGVFQRFSPDHPLIILPAAMVIRAIKFSAGEVLAQPTKQRLMPHMHT